MHRTKHAQEIATRFKTMVEQAGDSLSDVHYKELVLLIEAAIDTAVVDKLEKMADALNSMAHKVRNDAEFFD
jgi:hypothetical protein